MAEQLTAKYRPQCFAAVVGQDPIKKALSRAAQEDRVAPAYLFSGTRGVGKTTLARILAKVVNCTKAPTPEPCNKCPSCMAITKGTSPDVLEIDGASHTGVDHVRKLREDVFLPPLNSRYKVIIIDEAHMLSKAAFNALLKTLEEPPKHCIFIFATTEVEKFPITIVSRCQHYIFKSISQKEIEEHLKNVLKKEQIEFEPEAVELIAKKGNGSIRDAMSLLGQVLVFSENILQAKEVRMLLGLAGEELFEQIFKSIFNSDLERLHNISEEIRESGLDLSFFLKEFINYWRNLFLLSQLGKKASSLVSWKGESLEFWLKVAQAFGESRIHLSWQMVLEEAKSILKGTDPILALELVLFNLAYLPKLVPVREENLSLEVEAEKKNEINNRTIDRQIESRENNTEKNFREKVKSHPLVHKILEEFDARIVEIRKLNGGSK